MTQPMDPKQMLRLMAAWARERGIRRPTTTAEWQSLTNAFLADVQSRAQQVIGSAGDETYNSDPISRMTNPGQLLRDDGGMIDIADVETDDDDFAQLQRDKQRAMEQAGGDDLAAHSIYRDQQRRELNQQAPFVRSAPASVLSAVLGTTQQVTCGVDPVQVAAWAGDNTETRPVTVIVAPVQPIVLDTQGAIFRPFARISFSTGATQISVDVDINRGIQCTVSCSAIQLLVGLDADVSGNGVPVAQQILNISAMLSFDASMRQTPVTRTVWMDTPKGGAVTRFAIPAFAKRVMALTSGNNYTVARLLGVEDSIGDGYTVPIAANSQMTVPVDLPGDAVNITQSDATGAHDVGPCAFVFELSL